MKLLEELSSSLVIKLPLLVPANNQAEFHPIKIFLSKASGKNVNYNDLNVVDVDDLPSNDDTDLGQIIRNMPGRYLAIFYVGAKPSNDQKEKMFKQWKKYKAW